MKQLATDKPHGWRDAQSTGFLPESNGVRNTEALQRALDFGGTVVVSRPGIYDIAGTVLIGSHTHLRCGAGVFFRKSAEAGIFTHVLLNRGALTRTWDEAIVVEGLQVIVNGVDKVMDQVFGLRGHIAFFYVRDLRITGFRCHDVMPAQFAVHVCTFEDLLIEDTVIKGDKDGIHLGPGKRFIIRDGVFQTYDDAVALNAQDYPTSNPEMGWIENGLVENCHDLADDRKPIAYFCRLLAGAWRDWVPGMEVQNSDTVVSGGRLYRVQGRPDGTFWRSETRPTHMSGMQELDGIPWGMTQDDALFTAGVRNVTFRNIHLEKARIGFSLQFCNGIFNRSYYPGSQCPVQENVRFDGVRVLHDGGVPVLRVSSPVDRLMLTNCDLKASGILFEDESDMEDHGSTLVSLTGCSLTAKEGVVLLRNSIPGRKITLHHSENLPLDPHADISILPGPGNLLINPISTLSPECASAL